MSDETILVIDDNRQIANLMAGKILPGLGYRTLVAYDGETGLNLIRNHQPYIDLVLLDLQLPDMNGLALLRTLLNEGRTVPTILITAHGSEQIAVEAFRLGVEDYLIKPIQPDSLSETIANALAETRLRREKARLLAQLKEQVAWLSALTHVGRSMTATLDLNEVLRRIVDAGVYLTKAEEGFLALIDEKSGKLYLRAVKNLDETKISTLRIPVEDSLSGQVLRSGKPLRLSKPAEGSLLKVSTGYLVYSLLHVPIISRGKALGVLSVDHRTTQQSFKEVDDSVLLSLADYAAIALENARLYEQAQMEISERMRIEAALRESEERYALAVSAANDGLWDWDLKTGKIYYSPRWKEILGYSEDEISDDPKEWFERIYPDDLPKTRQDISLHLQGQSSHFENEHRIRHSNGTYRWVLSRGLAVRDESSNATRFAGSLTDITERKRAEQKLYFDAFHDSLTGLPNRTLLLDRLQQAIGRSRRRENYRFAVLFLDLDRFKDVNDSLGHAVGDKLLIAIAYKLGKNLRPTDTVARIGGDEFVILIDDINDATDATRLAERILKELEACTYLTDHTIFVTASIGIVLSDTGYICPEDILRDADIAMYRAKNLGRSRYEIFDLGMRTRIMERLTLEKELRQALEQQELRVYYQPVVCLQSGRLIGLEALVRWQHKEHGLIPPSRFIPLAEDTGQVILLDRWVLRQACSQVRQWQLQMPCDPPLQVSVNISGKQLTQADLVDYIKQVLYETGLPAQCLNIELTESAIMTDYDLAIDVFRALRNLGVQIQIDDFGIGYSSLSYLSHFPLNALKVDQTFVRMMMQDSNYLKIVQAIVTMTHGLGMSVIAEGVETEGQVAQLKALGCEFVQGYIMARAMDSQAVENLLEKACAGEALFVTPQAH